MLPAVPCLHVMHCSQAFEGIKIADTGAQLFALQTIIRLPAAHSRACSLLLSAGI
jgi:hypothetical protein